MTKTKLKSGQKQTMASRCLQCFADNVPPDITVHFHTLAELQTIPHEDLGDKLYGLADAATLEVWVRKPTTPNLLVIALHEVAHLVLKHSLGGHRRKPPHHFEHEAHRWAFLRMREAGLELPQATLSSMLTTLIWLAREDRDKGEIIDPEIKRIADLPPAEALKEWVARV
jgi:hypothetical protein